MASLRGLHKVLLNLKNRLNRQQTKPNKTREKASKQDPFKRK
jgi:hypothetical protein